VCTPLFILLRYPFVGYPESHWEMPLLRLDTEVTLASKTVCPQLLESKGGDRQLNTECGWCPHGCESRGGPVPACSPGGVPGEETVQRRTEAKLLATEGSGSKFPEKDSKCKHLRREPGTLGDFKRFNMTGLWGANRGWPGQQGVAVGGVCSSHFTFL
jgi:hypothetical protein